MTNKITIGKRWIPILALVTILAIWVLANAQWQAGLVYVVIGILSLVIVFNFKQLKKSLF